MAKPPSERRRRRSPSKRDEKLPGTGLTHPGLPYFSLDKELEKKLDEPPEVLRKLPGSAKTRLAVKLRMAGATYQQIAEKLGYASAKSCETSVRQVIQRFYTLEPDELADTVKLDLARLDAMQVVQWEKATRFGDEKAAKTILAIMDKRHELLGITDAGKSGVNVNIAMDGNNPQMLVVGGNSDDFIGQLQAMRGEEHEPRTNGHRPQQAIPAQTADAMEAQETGQDTEEESEVVDAEVIDE